MQILQVSKTKKNVQKWLSLFIASTAVFFYTACETVPSDTGLAVLPPEDQIGLVSNDTSTVILETRIIDKVPTGNTNSQMFGNYLDPVFGRVTATTFTQIVPGIDLNFGDTSILRVDSVVLALSLLGHYGRLETPQRLQVYEISEDFPEVEDLYSNSPLAVYPTDQCESCIVDFSATGVIPDIMRVHLSKEFGERLLFAPVESLQDKERFKEFFKGVAITTAPVDYLSREPGAIYGTFVKSSNSDITLYYSRKNLNGDYIPTQETFLINNDVDVKSYHTIIRSEAENKLLMANQNSDMFHFLQAGGLVTVYGKLPFIDQISTLGVNKADLVIKLDDTFLGSEVGTGNRYETLPQLRMYYVNKDGEEVNPDNITEIATLRPEYDSESRSYTFGMTPYVQRIMRGREENYGFVIRPFIENTRINRAVIGGSDHPTRAPVMKLVYTKENQ